MSRIRNRRAPGSRCRPAPEEPTYTYVGDVSTIDAALATWGRRAGGWFVDLLVYVAAFTATFVFALTTEDTTSGEISDDRRSAHLPRLVRSGRRSTPGSWSVRGGRRSGRWPWASRSCGAATPAACRSSERSDGRFDVAPRPAVRPDPPRLPLAAVGQAEPDAVRQDGRHDRRPSPPRRGPGGLRTPRAKREYHRRRWTGSAHSRNGSTRSRGSCGRSWFA